ncbi:protein trichome birefringence-like 38 [Pyrus ussuriensis x Pyrus communis]|uniref:Protein trichome birefringence-like 38 n=1 Tax=Pyrus ussuriensis x Pyrus communis TaxID=2448454 RepID=A0A5N5FWE2_9ROSA|nr:protein trichome birefringence-like 38 [Pyrus ussuriensis x Pyrus communis]
MDRLIAFREGLTTWSNWVDSNVDANRTKVFFQGISPTHYEMGRPKVNLQWTNSTVSGSIYPGGPPPATTVVKDVLTTMSTRITLLDVTLLSQLRMDGHPSVYGLDGKHGNDCSHWCFAGVPDSWNELLYAILVTTD